MKKIIFALFFLGLCGFVHASSGSFIFEFDEIQTNLFTFNLTGTLDLNTAAANQRITPEGDIRVTADRIDTRVTY